MHVASAIVRRAKKRIGFPIERQTDRQTKKSSYGQVRTVEAASILRTSIIITAVIMFVNVLLEE